MECVLTLVSAAEDLPAAAIAAGRAALHERGASTSPPRWLAPGRACDIGFEIEDEALDLADGTVRAALAAETAPLLDLFVQPAADRRKALLVADMDSTIVVGETLDDLAAFAGLKDTIAAITARAMAGELDFESALRERVAMLKGLPAITLDAAFAEVRYMPGAETLVRTMAAHGAHTMLVSGGFTHFTDRVAVHCGFAEARANRLILDGDRLAGTVAEPILGREAKLAALVAAAGARRLPLVRTLAVGDGANDLAMIGAAGLGVAYHAKPLVRAAARHRVDHGDLTALLFAQGYTAEDFVPA